MTFTILSFCLASFCFAQPKDQGAVTNVLMQQVAAWNKGDINAFMQTYAKTDSIMFIGSKGVTYGWDSTLQHYKNSYPDKAAMGTLSFELKQFKQLSGKYFYVVGKFILVRENGNLSGYFNLLLKKIRGQWLIVADHTS